MPNVHGNIIGEIVLILLIFGLSIGIIQRKIKIMKLYKKNFEC